MSYHKSKLVKRWSRKVQNKEVERRALDDDSVIKKLDSNGDVYYSYLALGSN